MFKVTNPTKHLQTLLLSICPFTSLSYQRSVWGNKECKNYDRYLPCVEDCLGDIYLLMQDIASFNITQEQLDLITHFDTLLSTFHNQSKTRYLSEDFTKTQEWNDIVNAAIAVLASFKFDATENGVMRKPLTKRYVYEDPVLENGPQPYVNNMIDACKAFALEVPPRGQMDSIELCGYFQFDIWYELFLTPADFLLHDIHNRNFSDEQKDALITLYIDIEKFYRAHTDPGYDESAYTPEWHAVTLGSRRVLELFQKKSVPTDL